MKARVALVVTVVLVASLAGITSPAMAGDGSVTAMNTAQARRAYLNAVCPMNDAIIKQNEAESAADANWPTVQPLVRKTSDMQARAARKLGQPKRPWPADIRASVMAVATYYATGSGANSILTFATSLEEYNALLKAFRKDLPAAFRDPGKVLQQARPVIRNRLRLPETGACDDR